MNTVLFNFKASYWQSQESKFTLYPLLLRTWRTNKIHLVNQINRAGNNLLTDSHTIIFLV